MNTSNLLGWMPKTLHLLAILVFAACGSDTVDVDITVIYPALPDSAVVYLSGDIATLGNWQPDGLALRRTADSLWQTRISFPAPQVFAFKITRGNWVNEAVTKDGHIPGNIVVNARRDTSLTIRVESWRDINHREFPVTITGAVRYHRNFPATGIAPRDVVVRLPESYERDPKIHYPVLYLHDGQNVFDARTSAFGQEWRLDETADSLARAGKIAEIIMVGINNSASRRAEYSDSETGQAYMHFLVNELKPFIDREYRTLPGREYTATMGASMGGLISFLLVWEYPQVFSMGGCLSPAFIYNNYNSVALVKNAVSPPENIRLYIDNGGIGLEDTLQVGCDSMLVALQNRGISTGKSLMWYRDPTGEHNEKAWARRAWRPLEFMFGR